MIAYLNGKLSHLEPAHAIVECGGVGYLAKISLNTYELLQGKAEVKLLTTFVVREDAQLLYGFVQPAEQALFEQLISISGIGGNTAMMILSSVSAADLAEAVRTENVDQLKRIKGIGPKTAGRIVLELKDKLSAGPAAGSAAGAAAPEGRLRQEALAALVSLGLPKAEMEKRLERILKDSPSGLSVEQLIKQALRNP
jgi:Holliday junction DNA helicase RuvA